MSKFVRTFRFEFTDDELKLLLKLVGVQSSESIAELGYDPELHDDLYNTLAGAVYGAVSDDHV